jgi:hypothetical protein
MRKRGPSGGGTLRRKSPQQGQWPSFGVGAVISARIHWPRASQSGLIHCTVKPGMYCIFLPQRPQSSGPFLCDHKTVAHKNCQAPWRPIPAFRSNRKKGAFQRSRLAHSSGTRGNSASVGADSAVRELWCQEKRLQGIVVRLQGTEGRIREWREAAEVRIKIETQRFENTVQTELEITKDRFTY